MSAVVGKSQGYIKYLRHSTCRHPIGPSGVRALTLTLKNMWTQGCYPLWHPLTCSLRASNALIPFPTSDAASLSPSAPPPWRVEGTVSSKAPVSIGVRQLWAARARNLINWRWNAVRRLIAVRKQTCAVLPVIKRRNKKGQYCRVGAREMACWLAHTTR